MRTNIDLEDKLLAEALKLTGSKTKKEVVTKGLRILVSLAKQEQIRGLRGKLSWVGNLNTMRRDR